MSTFTHILEEGQNAADFIFDEITDTGEVLYTNLVDGLTSKPYSGIIEGAKNNPTSEEIQKALFKASNPDFDPVLVKEEGLYPKSNFKQPTTYSVKEGVESDAESDAPTSRVNNWTLLKYRGQGENPDYNKAMVGSGAGDSGLAINPTANNIIQRTFTKGSASYRYFQKDFIFCEHYGKVANNHMLTLRRFPFPVEDNILDPKKYSMQEKKVVDNVQPALAQAVTWMSPTIGNSLNEILKFGVGFKWKEAEAQLQTIDSKSRDRGMVGGMIDSIPYSQNAQGGLAGESAATTYRRKQQGAGWDPLKQTYPNHTFAPLNIIKSMQVRDSGLTFDQSFSLTFNYDLKGIPNTSPKMAFLDILANLLVLTYNNAPFWGGAIRYTGGGVVGNSLGDLEKLKKGDIKGFMGSVMKDIGGTIKNVAEDLKGALSGDSKILNNVIGGGLMDLFGGPQGGQVAAAFLTGESTGQWHLTVGNPLNPIAVIGNLGCKKADFQFDGPLGYEDFPTKLKVVIELQPNRPRDKSDIESMFNAGKGRLYLPEQGVLDPSTGSYDVSAYGNKEFKGRSKEAFIKKAAKYANG